ncbi:MAG TPA: M36 family metallopeptidase [Frankiaceae bacterium]|nr:M36 family metallopeptidase [Frankiaceae bacterium]
MNRRILAGVTAAALASVALPATAGSQPLGRIESVSDGVVYGDLAPAKGDPLAVAAKALRTYAGPLGVDARDFRFDSVRKSLIGVHVRGAEVRGGVPVERTHALVTIADGRVIQVAAQDSDLLGAPGATAISAETATAVANAAAGGRPVVPGTARRMLVENGGRLVDAYRVAVLTTSAARTFDLAAANGAPLAIRDDNKYVDGEATAFLPNPIVTARDNKVRQPGVDQLGVDTDLPSDELDKQMRKLPLKGLDADDLLAGKLTGPWADVYGPTLPASTTGKFAFKRFEPGFETTMAYAHVDAIQRYFQSLGFSTKREKGVNDEPQNLITIRIETFDNSFYQPANDVIAFGTGGVDDAEDAEVIIHEYGHAVHDAQVPGWGDTHEGGAMGEGFGDFLAAAYYARVSRGYGDVCIADWDATSYSTKNPPCLRRADSKKRYPKDMTSETSATDSVHADGELWSSFLWRLRAKMGRTTNQKSDNVLKLLLTSHELLTPSAEFNDAIVALQKAARQLKRPDWAAHVVSAAKVTGMPYKA